MYFTFSNPDKFICQGKSSVYKMVIFILYAFFYYNHLFVKSPETIFFWIVLTPHNFINFTCHGKSSTLAKVVHICHEIFLLLNHRVICVWIIMGWFIFKTMHWKTIPWGVKLDHSYMEANLQQTANKLQTHLLNDISPFT